MFSAALATAALAGCGGEAAVEAESSRRINGSGYSFEVPAAWKVARRARTIEARPAEGPDAVSVTIFRLARPYRPELWPEVVPEIDGVVDRLAGELDGRRTSARTVTVAGRRARSYEVAFDREGEALVEELTFVLDGRREYQLLCRRPADNAEAPACTRLRASFSPRASPPPAR